jgi:hypothetical protein
VMQMAGHSNIDTTQRHYAAATEDPLALVRQAGRDAPRVAPPRQTDPKVTHLAVSAPSKAGQPSVNSLCDRKLRP